MADNSDDDDDLPLIEWKAYDPNEVYSEPGDQYAWLKICPRTGSGRFWVITTSDPQQLYQPALQPAFQSPPYRNQSGQENVYTNSNDMTTEQIRSFDVTSIFR